MTARHQTSPSRSVSTTVSPTTTSGLASQERSKSVSGRGGQHNFAYNGNNDFHFRL